MEMRRDRHTETDAGVVESLAIEQMMMNGDTGISEVASAVKRQGWMQVSHADEGRTGLLPAGQAMHSAEPVWLLYLPAAHRAQVPPLGPDEPALHVQSSAESLPDGEFAREGQLEHVMYVVIKRW